MDPNNIAWWWLESWAYNWKYGSSWETAYKEQEASRQSMAELPAQLLHDFGKLDSWAYGDLVCSFTSV